MSFFRRRIITAALSTEPPDIPSIAFEDVQLQNSASRNRISWQLTQASSIPATFRIERKIAAGSWVEVESAYVMSDPFTGYKMDGINRNFYYIDDGLTTAGTYQYRINSTALSNIITKTGITYYVKTGGDDNDDGLTHDTAWETIEEARDSATSTGDLVLFNKGDTFTSTGSVNFSGSGTSDNPIVWANYGSGNLPHLKINYSWGFGFRSVSYRSVEFLKFSGNLSSHAAIILLGVYTNNVVECRVLNCEVDASKVLLTTGASIYLYSSLNTPYDRSGNAAQSYHITDPEVAYCNIYDNPIRTGIRGHHCKSGIHFHNNYVHECASGMTCSGGLNHIVEYNEIKGGTYAAHSGSGAKANSQMYFLDGMIYRHNLIYYMADYALSLQSSKNATVEFNTVYDNGDNYGSFYAFTEGTSVQWEDGGNVARNNIFMGSSSAQGAVRVDKTDVGAGANEWYENLVFNNNCIFETAGAIIDFDNPHSQITTDAQFTSDWKSLFPSDIHEDPEFTDETAGDFTLQSGSPASDAGYTASSTAIVYLGHNLIENGDFHMWDGNIPLDWGVSGESDPTLTIREGDEDVILHQDSGAGRVLLRKYTILEVGKQYKASIDISDASNGTLRFRSGDHAATYAEWTTVGTKTVDFTAVQESIYFTGILNDETNFTFDNVEIREIISSVIINNDPGFESGNWETEWEEAPANGGDAAVAIDTIIVGKGTYSVKCSHSTKGGDTYNRCEIVPEFLTQVLWYEKYWVGLKVYLEDWATTPADWNTIMQLHTSPNLEDWNNRNAGDNAWTLWSDDTNLWIHSHILENPYTDTPTESAIGGSHYNIGTLSEIQNRWIDIVICWVSSPDSNGLIQWWIDGSRVLNLSGANIHYLDAGLIGGGGGDGLQRYQKNNIQIGSYKELNSTDERVVYFDEIRFAGNQAIYADVAP